MQYVCEKCITSSVDHYDELVDWIKSFGTCETSDVTTGSGGVEVIHEGSNELSAVLEAVTEIRDKISSITSCNETPKLEKRLYADIVRSTPETVQHVVVKPKNPTQELKKIKSLQH